jgi:hypothetical protein
LTSEVRGPRSEVRGAMGDGRCARNFDEAAAECPRLTADTEREGRLDGGATKRYKL